jgi:hypothetical protein
MDQLTALRLDLLDDVQKVLFVRKMPTYIRDAVNPKDCATMADLTERCNEVWEHNNIDDSATSRRYRSPPTVALLASCTRRSPPSIPQETPRLPEANPPPARQPPFGHARPSQEQRGWRQLVFLPHPLRRSRLQVRHRLLISGKQVCKRWPPASPPPDPLSPADPPPPSLNGEPTSATAMSFLPAKNLILFHDSDDTHNKFQFLVDSRASLAIVPHAADKPPKVRSAPSVEGDTFCPLAANSNNCTVLA